MAFDRRWKPRRLSLMAEFFVPHLGSLTDTACM